MCKSLSRRDGPLGRREGLGLPQACKYLYWDKGHRTFGDDIPGYAQGAYFPGDEPGWRCWLTRDVCPAESVEGEENCPDAARAIAQSPRRLKPAAGKGEES